jgi:NADP-dependent 3-hydroxy acid dehydrogenase YdfG
VTPRAARAFAGRRRRRIVELVTDESGTREMTSMMTAAATTNPTALRDRRALVTGASSGIGAATARALAAAGADVAVGARRADRLDDIVREIVTAGGRAVAVTLDVTDEESSRAAVDVAVREFGGLDLVVNVAGVMLLGPVAGANTDEWRRTLDTNVLGLMLVTHAALPHLLSGHPGTAAGVRDIVNVSSVAGRLSFAGSAAYNASKWAVNGFSEALRQEVTGQGVRVSVVEPGAVDTELTDHITHEDARGTTEQWYASMRTLAADDVAAAIVHIVSLPAHVAFNEVLVRPTDQI